MVWLNNRPAPEDRFIGVLQQESGKVKGPRFANGAAYCVPDLTSHTLPPPGEHCWGGQIRLYAVDASTLGSSLAVGIYFGSTFPFFWGVQGDLPAGSTRPCTFQELEKVLRGDCIKIPHAANPMKRSQYLNYSIVVYVSPVRQ